MDKQNREPEIEELGQFLFKLNKESDRGAVLIAATILDERLKNILSSFLLNHKATDELLEGFNAPLGTFSSRISACFALGLIQKNEFDEMNLIRKIRNEFAHTWDNTDFDSGKVRDLCLKLPWTGPSDLEATSSTKQRFNFAIAILLTDLLWRSRLVDREKRVERIWPNKSR
jgi:DNA-binding MltR family transcriptional regulator